jgi:hypothetical protein
MEGILVEIGVVAAPVTEVEEERLLLLAGD